MKTPPEHNIRIIMELNNADIVDMCISKKYNRRRPTPDITITLPIVLGMSTLRASMSLGSLGQRAVTS